MARRWLPLILTLALATPAMGQEVFEGSLRLAKAGNSIAQRNTADCLRTGHCFGRFRPSRIGACVWRMIILASGDPSIDESDRVAYRTDCGRPSLTNQERRQALRQAKPLFRSIYGRELPLQVLPAPNR